MDTIIIMASVQSKIAAISTYAQTALLAVVRVTWLLTRDVEDIDLPIVFVSIASQYTLLKDSEVLSYTRIYHWI